MAARRKSKNKREKEKGNPNQSANATVNAVGLTEIEMKLLRLALDRGAYEGEADNAAVMLIRKLRQRNVTADELLGQPQSSQSKYDGNGNEKMPFGKYRDEMIKNIPIDYLMWVLYNCTNIDAHLKLAIHKFVMRE